MNGQVDLLTASGWLFSVGDIATAKGTQIELAKRGIAVVPVDQSQEGRTTVIGGGHILGHQPHLRHFIVAGRHALNAVGVHATGDFSYLKEYRYVSVRDKKSASILGVPAQLVPCPAILLEPSKIAMRESSRNRGGHVVAHCDRLVEESLRRRSLDLLVVDPQPWMLNHWSIGGRVLPVTHSPERLISEIQGAHAVVTRSLHMGMFALAAQAPFCCIDTGDEPQSNKLRGYWARAGIPEVMYDGNDPIRHAVALKYDWAAVRARERSRCQRHFDEMAEALL